MEEEKKYGHLKVGDTVWVTKSRFRSSDEEAIEEVNVSKVGRKYITIRNFGWNHDGGQFGIEDGVEKSDYGYKRHLVPSPEAYYEERTRQRVYEKFRQHFSGWSCRLDETVKTEDIILAAQLMKIDLKLNEK